MKDFEDVKRWYHAKEEVGEFEEGNWVTWKDYQALLEAYQEIKWMYEELCK